MEDVRRLIKSRCGYRAHLRRLLNTTGEIMERCSNDSSEERDDTTTLADLIEQLERKRNILVDLDKQIFTGVSDDDLEAEEEIQSEISSTIARVKRLMQQLQALTHSSRLSSPSQVSQIDRSPSPSSSDTHTESLPTPPQSPGHQEDTHHDLTEYIHSINRKTLNIRCLQHLSYQAT